MKKLSVFLLAIFSVFIWISFATSSVINPSYTVNWDDVKIFWTDNSNGWYMDINVQDPKTNDWLHFGEAKISDQVFVYTKQWDWDQNIWIIPGDGSDDIKFTVQSTSSSTQTVNKAENDNKAAANRTVIPAVPKTGPSGSLIWIILAALAIFGGYIYIRKKADI